MVKTLSNPNGATVEPLHIFCDESGYTGPDLLNPQQRHYAFASVAVGNDDAYRLIEAARRAHRVQMPELKSSKLLKSSSGRALIADVVAAVDGHFAVCVHDKLFALGAHVFEYLIEPVFKEHTRLLYAKRMHMFVAMAFYTWFLAHEDDAELLACELSAYLRSLDESKAPSLFAGEHLDVRDPVSYVLQFARGYRKRILADNSDLTVSLPEGAKWLMDLSTTSLWVHLNFWGRRGPPLVVSCGRSKPLSANAKDLRGDASDTGIQRARKQHGFKGPLGWRLHGPIKFVDSRANPAIQLADILARVTIDILTKPSSPELEITAETIARHVLDHSMGPRFDDIDPAQRVPMVNSVILYGLAERSRTNTDPTYCLAEIHRLAEVAWARGELRFHGPDRRAVG